MKKSLSKAALSLIILMLASKCLGLLRESMLAYRFGTSRIVDAYTVSLTVANVALSVFTIGFSESYISVYTRIPDKRRNRFFNNTISIIMIGSFIIALCVCVFSDAVAFIVAPGFDSETHLIARDFIRIIAFAIPLQAVFAIMASNEMVREHFVFPRFCDFIVINIIVILAIILSDYKRATILPIGYVGANVAAVVLLLYYSIQKRDIKYGFVFDPRDADFHSLFVLAIPLGISFVINDLNTLTDGMFASTVGVGMTSALNYANKIQALFLAVTVNIISVVCFPRVASHFASGEKTEALYYLKKSMMIALYLAIPFMVFLSFYSSLVVKILFERGNFAQDSAFLTTNCLSLYCLGIPFYAMSNVENQALAAKAKQKTIMYVTVVSVITNIVLDFVLLKKIGYKGLPIATCCAGVVQFTLMLIVLLKLDIQIFQSEEIADLVKIIVSIICASIIPLAIARIFGSDVGLIVSAGICLLSFVVYLTIGLLLGIKIEKWLLSLLLNGIRVRLF